MLSHAKRIDAARAAIDSITGRSADEQQRPVPNCPGWTVYNAAAHIGRVAIAWEEMITSPPEDPQSRERGYASSAERPAAATTSELATWANSAIVTWSRMWTAVATSPCPLARERPGCGPGTPPPNSACTGWTSRSPSATTTR